MQSWIFQGNPTVFDIDSYLTDRKYIWWSIRQRRFINQIRVGDEIFLWRSDGSRRGTGGIVARAIVTGAPVERTDEDGKQYWKTDDWAVPGIGVPLEVLEVKLDESRMIKRTSLEQHEFLKNLQILRIRTMTNYLLRAEEAYELEKIWGSFIDYPEEAEESITFPEGRRVYKLHRTIERNPNLVRVAKSRMLETNGELRCQICDFSFYEKYGEIGQDYIEAHHATPLSEIDGEHEANINDIVLVCSNCHRMLHRKRPWLTVNDLSSLIKT